jgi:hypothetical protein
MMLLAHRGRLSVGTGIVGLFFVTMMLIGAIHYWPRKLPRRAPGVMEKIRMLDGHCIVYVVNRTLVGELAEFDDGFFAYLMFDYYRSRPALEEKPVMLVSQESGQQTMYRILVQLPADLIQGVNDLATLKAERLTSAVDLDWITQDELGQDLHQTTVFVESYSGPVPRTFERLHGPELQAYLRRFLRFKSTTDPRIYHNVDPVPSPLTRKQASRLAADMIAVSGFYGVPLDLLIGIGAMENNFMSVPGDSNNTAWKRHAAPGDIVLKRWRGRVLVKNDSSGVWQITRESLRYAHRLYLSDKRDYSQLPPRLRPPKELKMDGVSQDVLTTYAGLLLRDLMDQFHGNVMLAAGAYNGGTKDPNANYAAGVEMVADYARRMINRAAELNRQAVSETSVNRRAIKAEPR